MFTVDKKSGVASSEPVVTRQAFQDNLVAHGLRYVTDLRSTYHIRQLCTVMTATLIVMPLP